VCLNRPASLLYEFAETIQNRFSEVGKHGGNYGGAGQELRERTVSGMMECKRVCRKPARYRTAVDLMRKAGQAKADKKASRHRCRRL